MSEVEAQVRRCGWQMEHLVTPPEAGCQKPALADSDYCLAHKAAKSPEEVERFRQEIRRQLEAGDFDFAGYRFPPNWDLFRDRTLVAANFREAEFEGPVTFRRTLFELRPEGGVTANFAFVRFQGNAEFRAALFAGDVHFPGAFFARRAWFWDARFAGRADFFRARFEGEASFAGAWFGGAAHFREAVFFDLSAWQRTVFCADVDFTDLGALAGCRFIVAVPRADGKEEQQATRFAQPGVGSDLCRLAKETARRAGAYGRAGEYFYYERVYADLARFPWAYFAWRGLRYRLNRWKLPEAPSDPAERPLMSRDELQRAWFHPLAEAKPSWRTEVRGLLGLLLGWILFGYGERPFRLLWWSVAIILIFSLLYWQGGMVRESASGAPISDWLRNVYFSGSCFTTLGIGDFEPVKHSRTGMLLTTLEALSGMFMMALFVVSVAKRFTRG